MDAMLWSCLEECDSLSSSTASIIRLLAFRVAARDRQGQRRVGREGRRSAAADGGEEEEAEMEEVFGEGLVRLTNLLMLLRHQLASVRFATIRILAQVS